MNCKKCETCIWARWYKTEDDNGKTVYDFDGCEAEIEPVILQDGVLCNSYERQESEF